MVQVPSNNPKTKLNQIQSDDLYRAIDFQQERLKYLHYSGTKLTFDKNYSWYGTKRQFENLCKLYNWNELSLFVSNKRRF